MIVIFLRIEYNNKGKLYSLCLHRSRAIILLLLWKKKKKKNDGVSSQRLTAMCREEEKDDDEDVGEYSRPSFFQQQHNNNTIVWCRREGDVGSGCRFQTMGIPGRPRVYICQCGRFGYHPCATESHSWFLRTRPLFVSTTTFIVSPRNQDHKSAVSANIVLLVILGTLLCARRRFATIFFNNWLHSVSPRSLELPIYYPVMDPFLTMVHAASTPSAATASTHAGRW